MVARFFFGRILLLSIQAFVRFPDPPQITINKDKGSLPPEEVERMVRDAEAFAAEDRKVGASCF